MLRRPRSACSLASANSRARVGVSLRPPRLPLVPSLRVGLGSSMQGERRAGPSRAQGRRPRRVKANTQKLTSGLLCLRRSFILAISTCTRLDLRARAKRTPHALHCDQRDARLLAGASRGPAVADDWRSAHQSLGSCWASPPHRRLAAAAPGALLGVRRALPRRALRLPIGRRHRTLAPRVHHARLLVHLSYNPFGLHAAELARAAVLVGRPAHRYLLVSAGGLQGPQVPPQDIPAHGLAAHQHLLCPTPPPGEAPA